ncbi:MAG: leucine-rich repeat domain-containing protein, partial [Bacteroides sp.]|nr:leucine-rich repeat domain-containing protein [Bacteroides sp.]
MDLITKKNRVLLFIISIFISTTVFGEQVKGSILNELELSENKDTLLKYNGNHHILDLSKYDELSNVKVIGRKAFAHNHKLRDVILPHKVQIIGNGAFEGCEKLTRIYMPDCVEHIEAGAFWECSMLKIDELPKELKTIGENAFVKCRNLSITEIPNEV